MAGFGGGRVILGAIAKRVCRYSSLRALQPPLATTTTEGHGRGIEFPEVGISGAKPCAEAEDVPPRPQNDATTAARIDGKSIAATIKFKIANKVSTLRNSIGKPPGLAVVLVGQRKESHSFVRIKIKACEDVGIASATTALPADCTEDEVLQTVSKLNRDSSIHGIIVQLPLPEHVDEEKVLGMISPEKDVDGFHPLNMGNLALKGRNPLFIPCAAKACIELLLRSGVEIEGKNVVVIGRSKIVGLPTSLLLQRYHATVSILNGLTKNPEIITQEASIVVTDVGFPNVVRGSWLRPGAVVIDTGTNAIKDPNSKRGFRIAGDVCYEEAIKVASAITPVPGGVGPVTIAMLLSNILDSAKRAYEIV